MTRTTFLPLLSALSLSLLASSALAQDAPDEPEAGDLGASGAGPTGDVPTSGVPTGGVADDEIAAGDASPAPAAPEETAAAEPDPGLAKPVSVGLLLGYGISLESGGNPWGLGFGARGGYNLDKIYLGARFVFYLGDSQSATFGGVTSERSFNFWELGVEGGYDIDLSALTLRPEFGLGLANYSSDTTGNAFNTNDNGSTSLYLAPGVSVLYDVTPTIFLGIDARVQLVFAKTTVSALILLANAGMHF